MSINYNAGADSGAMPIVVNGAMWVADRVNGKRSTAYKTVGYFNQAQVQPTIATVNLPSSIFGVRQNVDQMVTDKTAILSIQAQSSALRNLEIAMFADTSIIAATGISADQTETLEVYTDGNNPFKRFLLTLTKVTNEDGNVTYEEGKNFIIDYGSIHILSGAEQTAHGATVLIEDEDVIKVTGKFMETAVLQGMTKDIVEKSILFTGMNVSQGQKTPLALEVFRGSAAPQAFNLLSDAEFGVLPINFEILADQNRLDGSKMFEYRTATRIVRSL